MSFDGKLLIVTSAPGGRDTVYIGIAERHGDMILLESASMITQYKEVGVPGLAAQPEKATKLRPATGPGRVWLPLCSVSAIVEADMKAWADHLGVSR